MELVVPLQTAAGYSRYLSYGIGALAILAVIIYPLLTRNTGREGDEADHERAVNKKIDDVTTSKQTSASSYGNLTQLLLDVEYMAGAEVPASRLTRLGNWGRRFIGPRVVAHAMPISDADGRAIHVAVVNGIGLAHRETDKLLDDVEIVAEAVLDEDRPPATMSEYYYEDIQDGFVDFRDCQSRVRGDCKLRIQSNMAREEELDIGELRETLVYDSQFRYPKTVVEEKLAELLDRDLRLYKDGRLQYQRYS